MLRWSGLAAISVAAALAWPTAGTIGATAGDATTARQPGSQEQRSSEQVQDLTPSGQQRHQQADRPRWHAGRPPYSEIEKSIRDLPGRFEPIVSSRRPSDRVLLGALAYGAVRGLDADRLGFTAHPGAVLVTNQRGETLFHLSDDRARSLGAWQMRRLGDQRPRGNAPAFCRSGEGHPVWGREWCVDRGFGLGSRNDLIWSRSPVDDIAFERQVATETLTRDALVEVLGDVAFHRIAVHSLALGFTDPLRGTWVAETGAPNILRIYAGDTAVAELVDVDGDGRIEVLYVVQPY